MALPSERSAPLRWNSGMASLASWLLALKGYSSQTDEESTQSFLLVPRLRLEISRGRLCLQNCGRLGLQNHG